MYAGAEWIHSHHLPWYTFGRYKRENINRSRYVMLSNFTIMKSIHFTTESELNAVLDASEAACKVFSRLSVDKRAFFLDEIAIQMELIKAVIVETASLETNLPVSRIDNEFVRTVYQLKSYAENCRKGHWMDVRIDTKDSEEGTRPNDLRKTYLGLGPVAVFGASNFPWLILLQVVIRPAHLQLVVL